MVKLLRGFGLNFLFWSIIFTFLLSLRFNWATAAPGVFVLPIEFPLWRVYGNGLLMGLLLSLPYTVMENVLRRVDIYSGSLLRIIGIRSTLQLILAIVVFALVGTANFLFDRWTDNVPDVDLSIRVYILGTLMRYFLLAALLGNVVLSVYRTLQMKIGEEIFHDLLFGRFNPAKEENRAFLFLDLKSSTSIAEELGHEQYSYFIQDCFRDLHPAVVSSQAEIYQYVGDEAVLTWKQDRALADHNCLRAFFLFKKQLKAREAYYQDRYGVRPVFKGGLNLGKVMTAEVGVIKRDIAYHSDVLNTAARVQELATEKAALFLVTEAVIDALPKPIPFSIAGKGDVVLRGKRGKTGIFEIEAPQDSR